MNLRIQDKIGQDKEVTSKILKKIRENNKILLVAPMAGGKTYFIANDLKEMAYKQSKRVVIVIPNVAHIDAMEVEYGIKAVHASSTYGGENIVAITPDKLLEVTSKLEPDSYYLVVDEGHEIYSSYSFRRKFGNVPIAEEKAHKVIFTTATPQNLDTERFDATIHIQREQKLVTSAEILEVDKLDNDTLKMVIGKYKSLGQTIVFNNDIEGNEILTRHFHKINTVKEKVLMENYQQELTEDNASYEERESVSVIYRADTFKAGDKDTEIIGAIKNGFIPKEVDLLLTTSAIKAGINIDNDPNAIAIVVCHKKFFNLLDAIQQIGRFRNGLQRVIFVIEKENKQGKTYHPLETVREKLSNISKQNFKWLDEDLTLVQYKKGIIEEACAVKVEDKDKYRYDHQLASAKEFKAWAESLLIFPNILRKHLMNNGAIYFKDIELTSLETKDAGEELKEEKDRLKEERTEKLEKAIKYINNLEDEVKLEVLSYTLDQRKAPIETVEAMNAWHKLAKGKKDKVEQMTELLHAGNTIKAFDDLASRHITNINKELKQATIKLINKDINNLGAETLLNGLSKRTLEVKTAKIRYELKDIEDKQGRITQDRIDQLTETLVSEDYISDKVFKNPKSTEKDKEKALKRLAKGLDKEIKLIYNLKNINNISSARV